MAILRTLTWWEDSVEMAALSLISCRPHKTTWGSGEEGSCPRLNPKICKFFLHRFVSTNGFQDSMDNGHGFQLKYESSNVFQGMINRFDECGGYFSTPNGNFTSPSYPDNYPANEDCIYTISQPIGTVIMLNLLSMDIESHSTCGFDYLEIRDGPSDDSPLLGKLCGNVIPAPIQSVQNQMWMR